MLLVKVHRPFHTSQAPRESRDPPDESALASNPATTDNKVAWYYPNVDRNTSIGVNIALFSIITFLRYVLSFCHFHIMARLSRWQSSPVRYILAMWQMELLGCFYVSTKIREHRLNPSRQISLSTR